MIVIILMSALCPAAVIAQDRSTGISPLLVRYPDTIFMNATIVTLDNHEMNTDPGSIVQAMAVRDDMILALGSEQDILALAGPETEIIDLGGKMVLPGIVESHVHPMGNSESFAREKFGLRSTPTGYDLSMDVAATPDETMAQVARAMELLLANAVPGPDDWISISLNAAPELGITTDEVAALMNSRRLSDVKISKDDISEIVPNHPFLLTSGNQIFGKTGYDEEGVMRTNMKNIWYHITVDEHGDPVSTPVIEFKP